MPDYRGEVHAPDFPPGADWINTERPLAMHELRGKVVLLDFWTFCCINCMHILPDLKKLEHKYPRELVVVGVHSAKFSAERETDNVRQAVLRYQIEHPVVNDPQMSMWQQYGVRAWPTVALIDPEGKVIGGRSGEGIFEPFDQIIAKVIEVFDAEGKIDRRPLGLILEQSKTRTSLLSFPGKVLADAAGGRLFIADTNHNRIVVASLEDGAVREVIGEGETGLADGAFERAQFHHPNGIALDGECVYIADTENHAIRRVDLAARTVETLTAGLNSPWDLAVVQGQLYIAMAGPHQLWRIDLAARTLHPHAGSGREGHIDGPLAQAALAQPSGITTDGSVLFFADSEISSIRAADLDPGGVVATLVGQDLFDYGDVDGVGEAVRLQHPLGVLWLDGFLYVADSYNNKIKILYPQTRGAATFAGTGRAGLRDGPADESEFDEPAGLSAAHGKLYVADTNNHVIRVIDLASREVSTLQLREMQRLIRMLEPTRLAPLAVKPGPAELRLVLELPEGYKWNPEAPVQVSLSTNGRPTTRSSHAPGAEIRIPFDAGSQLELGLTAYYCGAGREALCLVHQESLAVPLQPGESGVVEIRRRVK